MHILSRVADSVYWLNRYVERAENYARLIETYQQLSLEHSEITGPLWYALVKSTADVAGYERTYRSVTQDHVVEFLTFNRQNLNSIASCLYFSRENARKIREKISKDMWEAINELFSEVSANQNAAAQRGSAFFRDIRRSCHAFYGISDGTLNHDETYHFSLLGRTIERADKTTRILDLQSYMFMPNPATGQGDDAPANYAKEEGWKNTEGQLFLQMAVLKATSAHEMFNQSYARVTAENILEFLVQSRTFPRAISACLLQIEYSLRCLAGEHKGFFVNAAQKKVQKLLLETRHTDMAALLAEATALNGYLDTLQVRLNDIGTEISNTYFTAA